MLAHLIALGVFATAAGTGDTNAPVERVATALRVQATAAIGNLIPLGAPVWAQHFEPADHAGYVFTFDALLPTGEKIASIDSIRMSPAAAALGVMVDASDPYRPVIDAATGRRIKFYPIVDPEYWESAAFDVSGVRLPIAFRVITDAAPPQRFERTGVLVVRQQ